MNKEENKSKNVQEEESLWEFLKNNEGIKFVLTVYKWVFLGLFVMIFVTLLILWLVWIFN